MRYIVKKNFPRKMLVGRGGGEVELCVGRVCLQKLEMTRMSGF